MSILKFVKTEECPECGCRTVGKESVELDFEGLNYKTHCNGGRWERREFACGYKVEYIPNFTRDEKVNHSECQRSLEYLNKMEKLEATKQALRNFCKKHKIPESNCRNMKYYLR